MADRLPLEILSQIAGVIGEEAEDVRNPPSLK
jgi:hypothetical protein